MEVASPPKRMTRARAAAKDAANANANANANAGKNTATATATAAATSTSTKSAKAAPKSTSNTSTTTTRPTTTTRTATKRKTRADDTEDEDNQQTDAEQQSIMNKPARARGRPKRVAETQPEPESKPEPTVESTSTASTKASRSRAKRPAIAPRETAIKSELAKTRTSTRTRKTPTSATDDEGDGEPVTKSATTKPTRKTTRTRATTGTKATAGTFTSTVSTEPTPGLKSAVSRPASRIGGATKKTVTFQEPEKENMLPPPPPKTKGKTTEPATGMRAKPVRKPAASTRATRASARTATTSENRDKSPLSPKKDAENISLSRDADSDDELATLEKTPLKPLMKSPIKPPKKAEAQPPTKDEEDDVKESSEPTTTSVLSSPARRPPSSSPFKDAMKSPARKVEAIPSLVFSANTDQQAAQAPSKPSILHSPAKRPQLPIKSLQPPSQESTTINHSPIKISLLQSPAKRPTSPFKLHGQPPPMFNNSPDRLFAPKMSPVQEKAQAEETEEVEEVQQPTEQPEAMDTEDELGMNEENEEPEEEHVQPESPSVLTFPGRLSAVLPRHADPALRNNPLPAKDMNITPVESAPVKPVEIQEPAVDVAAKEPEVDAMEIDEVETKQEEESCPAPATPPSPPKQATNPTSNGTFGLRARDLVDHEVSDSEDELAPSEKAITKYQDETTSTLSAVPATPTPSTFKASRTGMPSSAAKAASRAIRSVSKGSKFGFSQLGDWKAPSPSKQNSSQQTTSPDVKDEGFSLLKDGDSETGSTPSKGYFEEEMRIRAEMENQAAIEAALEAEIEAMYGDTEPEFDNIPITEEDVQLAHEANEMSLIEEDAVSEASQEYGDENAVPIDPALFGSNGRRLDPLTPSRTFAPKSLNTTSKVPLKPADDSTPRIVKKRSASVSKLPPTDRPGGLFRNATVISYSPTKDSCEMEIDGEENETQFPPVTPTKTDLWSSMGTPARTPRRDLNVALLRGAVVFVDVHTSDGADASAVFVELLQQMGARCVKSWPWNPTSPTGPDGSAKVGITHVVYKDGGKRTLEKVRETNGVVQCVGVGWVLDCERENQWLDESPYYVDTSLVPRGGHNRRKSMEPKALANFNGTLVTPMKQTGSSARECQTVPNNHISRRDSTVWMRTPSDHDEDEDAPCDHDWDRELSMLTPVPKTPAPEAVRQFAMDVTPGSSMMDDSYGDFSPEKELLMRTCPPKSYADLGEGVLKRDKDQGILMRLMAARRKSLQFAPKVASPLSKAWN
ncbi:hypothetical protein F4805DRAFT_257846 [Annulohypoxylon moriforme]|nr:hypothetical protein F4805DRAFT_257846 [Annulohypoxylon moriforme]